jgi:hypothetical protein
VDLSVVVPRRRNQALHDRCIQRLAQGLSLEGWSIEAHVGGWPKPPYINDFIPDIRARKGEDTRIIEVETEDTLNVDIAQHHAFQRYAAGSPGTTFLLYLAREDGTSRLIR